MSLKILLVLTGLIALSSVIEAKSLFKKIYEKDLSSYASRQSGDKAMKLLLRKRRDIENTTDSGEDDSAALAKFFLAVAWESDKLDVLSGFIEEISDSETNLTVIGWQRIVDEQGQVKEINTIQLVIPPKPADGTGGHDDDDDDDEEDEDEDRVFPYNTIKEIKEVFEPFNQIGVPVSVTVEEFSKKGENLVLVYIDKDELYAKEEGFAAYNKTAIATPQEVEDFIKHLKPAGTSVLKYDVDGKLIVDKSHIRPHVLGSVVDFDEVPAEILLAGPTIIAEISQKYPKEQIPKQLAKRFTKNFPDYKWRVLVDPAYSHTNRDVSITLSYDNFDFDENSYVNYLVNGYKNVK